MLENMVMMGVVLMGLFFCKLSACRAIHCGMTLYHSNRWPGSLEYILPLSLGT